MKQDWLLLSHRAFGEMAAALYDTVANGKNEQGEVGWSMSGTGRVPSTAVIAGGSFSRNAVTLFRERWDPRGRMGSYPGIHLLLIYY